ncbi:TraR/DksA family transcriptional regulator [Grimontia sp. NTOU-MAR1]|uniref:TraR/DksA family transcriptional regulator n=1 Tax=Grimontia sp. NTOU-MAR1 TaxID=3111011 RepID=UPI002DB84D75|nr:TraR/DksA C4-type zinc finger protein [Grimontia sp. NTOU-MAR1]WRW00241.1 TraR/DksA C4-type zinc finger protein [Grimontia sp. NTOU-MAR1]
MNTKTKILTEEEILKQPESKYMDDDQLAFFKQRLINLHEATRARIEGATEQMVSPMDFSDPSDRATSEEQSALALRIVEREQKLLPKIQLSLERIRLSTYGYCLETGEPIGLVRLLIRPTAEYCADVKAVMEMKELQFKD